MQKFPYVRFIIHTYTLFVIILGFFASKLNTSQKPAKLLKLTQLTYSARVTTMAIKAWVKLCTQVTS